MPPGTTCSPTSKDTTIVSGFIPLSGISPPNRQSAKPLNPVSTKSGEGQRADHAQYLDHWLGVMKADKKAIFAGASKASEAAGFLAALQSGCVSTVPATSNRLRTSGPTRDTR